MVLFVSRAAGGPQAVTHPRRPAKAVIIYHLAFKRVIVTPAVYPRFIEFLHFDIQSTGQKSHCVNARVADIAMLCFN